MEFWLAKSTDCRKRVSVRLPKWPDLLQMKIKMFLNAPLSICHIFDLERSKFKVKDAKMPKSFFGRNFAAITSSKTAVFQFRGGYACCASHCRVSCSKLFSLAQCRAYYSHEWRRLQLAGGHSYIIFI